MKKILESVIGQTGRIGEIKTVLAGINVGKSLLMEARDAVMAPPSFSTKAISEVVLDTSNKTLTYMGKDGKVLAVITDYDPKAVRVIVKNGAEWGCKE